MESSERTAWLSILTNLLLVGIKTAIAVISGSLAVKADAIHSLSDVVSSSIILVGIKISARQVRGFPYGLYKVENLVALGTSILILFAGYEIIKEVFTAPIRPLPSQIPIAIAGIGTTILITWLFSRYELKKGRETGSPSLVADAQHIWTDMLSSLVIVAALLGSAIGFAIDRYAAIVVVLFIGRSAITIFLDSIRVLLDASLDYGSLNRIREIVLADPRVMKINQMWARNAGRYKFVELDLTIRVKELEKGHLATEQIKRRIKEEMPYVDHILIHCQPRQREQLVLGFPLTEDRQTISEHFGEAPFFRLLTFAAKDGKVAEERMLSNPYLHEKKAKGIKVANWLLEKGLDILIVRRDQTGKGPGLVLGNAGSDILVTVERNADKALAAVQNKLGKSIPEEFEAEERVQKEK